jgi:hypothetical protein
MNYEMLVRLTTNDFSFLGGPKVDAATDNLCHYVVSSYTTLKLAFEQDTLPAFSGIAQKLTEQHNYLAGIRKDHLMQDLISSSSNVKRISVLTVGVIKVAYRAC